LISLLSGKYLPYTATPSTKKSGKETIDIAYGLTSHSPMSANSEQILKFNRDHWGVESHHYLLDWNWHEDRCAIRKGHGPENITSLRRFAAGLIKSISKDSVAATIKKLARNLRHVFDYRLSEIKFPKPNRNCDKIAFRIR
jgi:predicted transposase YbfD/YdcC